ncbi:MAG: glycosyltransferase family 4 protein [Clostridia bacterium]|nr:glycosyltransferase family 4 protein [Clostridia bacterium]
MEKAKILIVHNQYKLAGGEDTVAQNEGELLQSHGHEVHYYIRRNEEIGRMNLFGKIKLACCTFFSWRSYREIDRIIRQNQIDVVHVHNTVPLVSCAVYYAAKKNGCTLVQSIHNMRMLCPTGLMIREDRVCEDCVKKGLHCAVKYGCYHGSKQESAVLAGSIAFHRMIGTYRKVDAYLVTTEFNRKLLEQVVPAEKIYWKPYYSDSETKSPEGKTRDYFIYISRLEHLKGIQVALEAFRKLPNEKLVVLGVGPDEEKAHRYVQQHKMSNVTFLGFKAKKEMVELLYNAKALVFPTQWYEGYPMTIVESLAVGTPIIGSDIGNVGTIVKNHVNGLTFAYNDPADLAEKVQYLASHQEEARQLEAGAQNTFVNEHLPQKVYEQTISVYEKCRSN